MFHSIRDRYQNDPAFQALVDMMVAYIQDARYTPSEMREASILASIIYEELRLRREGFRVWLNPNVERALRELDDFLTGQQRAEAARDNAQPPDERKE